MAEGTATAGNKLKVFVSYSRRDVDFADQLVTVLADRGFEVVIDRKDIDAAERWKERLGQLILQSDIVVFVLSPDSARSDICAWEVEEAARRAKRVIPVLCRALEGELPPARLRDLNYIYFYRQEDVPGSGFGSGLVRLTNALSLDVAWLREHTRLEEQAARWEAGGRHEDVLVRGSELAGAIAWRDRQPANAPALTDMQRAFLAASEAAESLRASEERKRLDAMAAAQAERGTAIKEREEALKREAEVERARARQRRVIALVSGAAVLLLILGIAGFAFQQARLARQQSAFADQQTLNLKKQAELTAEAQQQEQRAKESAELAEAKRQEAEANYRQGQITESHFRAEQAKQAGDDVVTATLLALEGRGTRHPTTSSSVAGIRERGLARALCEPAATAARAQGSGQPHRRGL